MEINVFKNRILSGGKVYLLLEDCAEVLGTDVRTLKNICDDITDTGIGDAITEDEFNCILREYFPDAHAVEQFTSFETLDVIAGDIIRMYPLKQMFVGEMFAHKAEEFGMTVDKYIEQIDFPDELKKKKESLNIRHTVEEQIEKYKEQVEQGIADVRNIPFERFGLELQHLTVLEKGHVNIITFYAGEGIFWSIMPESMCEEIWEEAVIDENGAIRVPSADYGGYLVLPKDINRDFREYPVIENILYCLDTIQAKDEWTDYIELREGGVNIEVSKALLSKLINPKSFPEIYYFAGIPDIESYTNINNGEEQHVKQSKGK